jgi:putative spermidine/putrescine transport system substrate-binding protein
VTASTATVESGATNIVLEWDYIQASEFSPAIKGWKVILPSDAILGGYGSQAISATAPHPAAARLWEEFLYSTEGQNFWLAGLARPVELPQMTADHTANPTFLSQLPAVPANANLLYPSTTQTAAAGTAVDSTWAGQLG